MSEKRVAEAARLGKMEGENLVLRDQLARANAGRSQAMEALGQLGAATRTLIEQVERDGQGFFGRLRGRRLRAGSPVRLSSASSAYLAGVTELTKRLFKPSRVVAPTDAQDPEAKA